MVFQDSGIEVSCGLGPIGRVRKGNGSLTLGRMGILDIKPISAAAFALHIGRKTRKRTGVQIFAASLRDINKALQTKIPTDPLTKLPRHLHDYVDVFDRKQADTLPPLRGPGIDHKVELTTDEDGKKPEAPWGPLYNMSREELLVLRKYLTEYLDKGFIRVSNSPAAAPVLLARKPGGGLNTRAIWRDRHQGLLKPLPIPDRKWTSSKNSPNQRVTHI
jgi:hypothetical protein